MGFKISKKCVSYLFISLFTSFSTFAFNGNTHRYITKISLDSLSEINKEDPCFSEDDISYWDTVKEYSLKPDEDEIEGAFKYHFYNPVTESNFMGEKNSALTKCAEHYSKAVKHYKEENKLMSFQELGRSIHFLEDLNTPVHTGYDLPTDALIKFPLHVRFEKLCDKICQKCKFIVNLKSLKYFKVNTVETIAKSSSVMAANNFYCLDNETEEHEEKLACNAILNAHRNITGLIYKFFKEVKLN